MNSKHIKIIKTSVQSGVFFSVLYSGFWFLYKESSIKLFLFNLIATFICWTFLVFFFLLWTNHKSSKLERTLTEQGINIIYSGMANHVLNGESIGGHIFLTDDKIIFKGHGISLQKDEFEILLSDITTIETYKVAGMFGNGIKVVQQSKTDSFVIGSPSGGDRKELLNILSKMGYYKQ